MMRRRITFWAGTSDESRYSPFSPKIADWSRRFRSTVSVFGGIAGVSVRISPATRLAIESGLRYQTHLREDPSDPRIRVREGDLHRQPRVDPYYDGSAIQIFSRQTPPTRKGDD
jgi:hypothetical protein